MNPHWAKRSSEGIALNFLETSQVGGAQRGGGLGLGRANGGHQARAVFGQGPGQRQAVGGMVGAKNNRLRRC